MRSHSERSFHNPERRTPGSDSGEEVVFQRDGIALSWCRLWARLLDYLVLAVALLLLQGLAPQWMDGPVPLALHPATAVFWMMVTCLWVIPETALLTFFGTTPGKWLFSIRVTTLEGEPPTLRAAFLRSVQVWVVGVGLGLPALAFFTALQAHRRFRGDRCTLWDTANWLCCTQITPHSRWAAQLAGATLATAGLVALTLTAPAAHLTGPRAGTLDENRHAVSAALAERGFGLVHVTAPLTGVVHGGGTARIPLEVPPGYSYLVLGGADSQCAELDLTVHSGTGRRIGRDRPSGPRPVAVVRSGDEGPASVAVTLPASAAAPCAFTVQVFWMEDTRALAALGPEFSDPATTLVVMAPGPSESIATARANPY